MWVIPDLQVLQARPVLQELELPVQRAQPDPLAQQDRRVLPELELQDQQELEVSVQQVQVVMMEIRVPPDQPALRAVQLILVLPAQRVPVAMME